MSPLSPELGRLFSTELGRLFSTELGRFSTELRRFFKLDHITRTANVEVWVVLTTLLLVVKFAMDSVAPWYFNKQTFVAGQFLEGLNSSMVQYTIAIMQLSSTKNDFFQVWAVLMVTLRYSVKVGRPYGRSKKLTLSDMMSSLWAANLLRSKTSMLLVAIPLWLIWSFNALRIIGYFVSSERAARINQENLRLVTDYMRYEYELSDSQMGTDPVTMRGYKYLVYGEDMQERSVKAPNFRFRLKVDDDRLLTAEKVWSLTVDDKLLGDRADAQTKLKDVCLSFALYKLLRRRFHNLPSHEADQDKTRHLIVNGVLHQRATSDDNGGSGSGDNGRGSGSDDHGRGSGSDDDGRVSGNDENGSGSGSNDNGRVSGSDDNGSGSGNAHNCSGSGSADNGRGSSSDENGRGSGSDVNGHGSGSDENGRGSGSNVDGHGSGSDENGSGSGSADNGRGSGSAGNGSGAGGGGCGGSSERAFRITAIELSFLQDSFHGNHAVMFVNGFPWRRLILSVLLIAALSFLPYPVYYIQSKYTNTANPEAAVTHGVPVTYGILFLIILKELWEIKVYVFSQWTMAWMLCKYIMSSKLRCSSMRRVVRLMHRLITRGQWDQQVGQYNLLIQCSDLKFTLSILRPTTVKLEACVKKAVLEFLQDLQSSQSLSSYFPNAFGNNQARIDQFSWADKFEADTHRILVWHIATCLCEIELCGSDTAASLKPFRLRPRLFVDRSKIPAESEDMWGYYVVSVTLSNYCAYLLTLQPRLVPDNGLVSRKVFLAVIGEVHSATRSYRSLQAIQEHLVGKVEATDGKHMATVKMGAELARQLLETYKEDNAYWKILSKFWRGFLLHLAASTKAERHKTHLQGRGELITHLWALLSHAGFHGTSGDEQTSDTEIDLADFVGV